ncbi:ABC transporter permease [Diaminobutyricimonas sp. LJ205]|uniref:ABC transporter permease n=1 Tax=Diaminobutyricimonas sp. LJ205 TaxID=2683590 RepID=UPI0012F50733|nr:ABC transporter permease [Diaminobutyricimonas sp. LJ205]
MRTTDVITSAARNVFRSKLRTTLTVLALVIGAFTLTLTQALGAGVNRYLDDETSALGAEDVLIISQQPEEAASPTDGPAEYEPAGAEEAFATPRGSYMPLRGADLEKIEAVDGIGSVLPVRMLEIDYISGETGTQYEFAWSPTASATEPPVVAGGQLDHETDEHEVMLSKDFAEALGHDDYVSAIGEEVQIGVTDANGDVHETTGTVIGVTQDSLFTTGIGINEALSQSIGELQYIGAPEGADDQYAQVSARFDLGAGQAALDGIKDDLADLGYEGMTVDDQMGVFKTVIDAIIAVLSGFSVIALIAAGFGIVNTLLMSVQERTREIGLMKALGMGNSRVFGLFSLEAVAIGLLGSAIGALLAAGTGMLLNGALADGLLADMPGLTLLVFEPLGVGSVIAVIAALALLAGTLPAARAARHNPIDALRYE